MPHRILSILLLLAAASLAGMPRTYAEERGDPTSRPVGAGQKTMWTARVVRGSSMIGDLRFPTGEIAVTLMPSSGKLRPFVSVPGAFARKGWTLTAGGAPVRIDGRGDFTVSAFLSARENRIECVARSPDGREEKETIVLLAPGIREFRVSSPWGDLWLSSGLGRLTFYQTGYGDFSAWAAVLSALYSTPQFLGQWKVVAQASGTVVTFGSSPGRLNPQLFSINIDASRKLNGELGGWKTSLLGGMGYVTMLSNGSPFGFSNLIAPEIGAGTSRDAGPDSSYSATLRYSSYGGLLSFDEFGLVGEIAWSRRLPNSHKLSLTLGLRDHTYLSDPTTRIHPAIVTFEVGYAF